MKTYMVGTALTAIVLFGAAGVPLADPLASGPFELTGAQLDAVTAGSTSGEAVAVAIATGSLISLAQTNTTSNVAASFVGDEILGTSATGIATSVGIGLGGGAGRATDAEATTTAEGNVVGASTNGTFANQFVEISYAASASFGTIGPQPLYSP